MYLFNYFDADPKSVSPRSPKTPVDVINKAYIILPSRVNLLWAALFKPVSIECSTSAVRPGVSAQGCEKSANSNIYQSGQCATAVPLSHYHRRRRRDGRRVSSPNCEFGAHLFLACDGMVHLCFRLSVHIHTFRVLVLYHNHDADCQ